MAKKKYYAVREGKSIGIFNTWDECKKQVHGYKNAEYKSFTSIEEADKYLSNKQSIDDIYGVKLNEELRAHEAVLAYVDGSFSTKENKFSYGCVLLGVEKLTTLKGVGRDKELTTMRNVAGEILGSEVAIKWAMKHKYKKIVIHYDYTGIEYWANGEWKANKKGTQDYKAFIKEARKKIIIEFVKIEAHTGDKYNEEADQLAKLAIVEDKK